MEKIVESYEKTIDIVVDELRVLLSELGIENKQVLEEIKNILIISTKNITTKWANGKKFVRTYFAKKAIPEYPEEVFNLSISIDAMINILDDLYDEILDKQAKALYVVELLRTISLFSSKKLNDKTQKAVHDYFNKIIIIAATEKIYTEMMKNEVDVQKNINFSYILYNLRSTDMDIFVEIPLIEKFGDKDENISKIARIFRALNLIKKDIIDIEHDKENKIETVITLLLNKFGPDLIKSIIKLYENDIEKIKVSGENGIFFNNFIKMIDEEKQEIEKFL